MFVAYIHKALLFETELFERFQSETIASFRHAVFRFSVARRTPFESHSTGKGGTAQPNLLVNPVCRFFSERLNKARNLPTLGGLQSYRS